MRFKHALTLLAGVMLFLTGGMAAVAQSDLNGWTLTGLNMRTGPGPNYAIIEPLPVKTGLIFEARNSDITWLLAQTEDQRFRGWISTAYIAYKKGFDPSKLPISNEIIGGEAPKPVVLDRAYEAVDMAKGADLILARAEAIDLTNYPIVPRWFGQVKALYERGQAMGRNPKVITKVGDCNSVEWLFLTPFSAKGYNLGGYGTLQPVIAQFSDSFDDHSYAAHVGLNVMAVLDPIWADPSVCEPGESPLACEYRVKNPSMAVIMFGTNDMVVLTYSQFDFYLRQAVNQTIQAGIVPILSTFPRHLAFPDRSILYNQIVVRVALDYNIPLINLWLALEPLPSHGIGGDSFHLNGPLTRAGDLTEPNLQTGYPMRNLVTLQGLDQVWREVTGRQF